MNRTAAFMALLAVALFGATPLRAGATIQADPSNYRTLLATLRPGDTLNLSAGTYARLPISQLNGTPSMWITIAGPLSGRPAEIAGTAGYNTVEIINSSYLAIENLRINSRGIPGVFGISAKGREQNLTHHIRIERNTLVGQNAGQQTDAISTKIPTWGWVIRNNHIINAGTGLYLGDSDGTQPFVNGLIENNLIENTIGYNMQIKDQISIPPLPGMPLGITSTIIRNNVFIKDDQPSPDGDRPNLLVGAFPGSGAGSLNLYEIYGNYFARNHREALFQGSGRVSLHDNIFIDGPPTYPAVVLRKQNYALQIAQVYNNTIYTGGPGIYFGTQAEVDDAVVGNLVFSSSPIAGAIRRQAGNMVDTLAHAPAYVASPSLDLGSADFYPLAGKCQGYPLELSSFGKDSDYSVDFNGTPKEASQGAAVYRGAYSGEGRNPGWRLQAGIKPSNASGLNQVPRLLRLGGQERSTQFGK